MAWATGGGRCGVNTGWVGGGEEWRGGGGGGGGGVSVFY